MKLLHTMLVAVFMLVASTSAHAGKMAKSKEPLVVAQDKANIVFMRPGKFVGAAIAVPVYDVTGEESKFVGLIEPGAKVAYSVPAGEHVFMSAVVRNANTRFYKAQVEAGKTYYFYVHLIDGIWGMEPVRASMLDGDDFKGWDKGTTLTENSPKTIAWSEQNKDNVTERRKLLPETITDANTLRTEDGR